MLALASSCGLATEGVEFFDEIEGPDASIDDVIDSGAHLDASSGAKDGGTDSGDQPVLDAGKDVSTEDGSPDAETDAEPEADADLDGGSDADDEEDSGDEPDLDAGEDADATEPPDADADTPPGPCVVGADPCDKDCDGARAIACGGNDCCDTDPRVFVGQAAFFTVKNACGSFDYNCDGTEQKKLGLGKACSRPFWDNKCEPHQDGFKNKVPECGEPGIAFIGCTSRTFTGGCDSKEDAFLQACR